MGKKINKMCELCFRSYEISEEELESNDFIEEFDVCKECEKKLEEILIEELRRREALTEEELIELGVKILQDMRRERVQKSLDFMVEQGNICAEQDENGEVRYSKKRG